MIDRAEFLQRRKSGIGGSDVAAVLGVSKWKTAFELYQDKTSDIIDVEESDILHFGNILEQVVANEFSRRNNVKVQKRNSLYRHSEHPELIANIDRYVVGGAILECKTCSAWAQGKFGKAGDEIPDEYQLQIQHYMYVTGIREAYLAVLIGGNEYRQFEIPYHSGLAEHAAGQCVAFWQNHVLKNVPPAPTSRDQLTDYYIAECGASITATPHIQELIEEYKILKADKKECETRMDEVKFAIQEFAGNNELILNVNGDIIATWKQGKDRATVNWKALCEDHGITEEEIVKYTKYSGNRPLNVKQQ
jgi:putative phage-type endonuclease